MEYLSTHVGSLPTWSIIGMAIAALLLIAVSPLDAWIQKKQSSPSLTKKRAITFLTVFSLGLAGAFFFLFAGMTQVKAESNHALVNLSYNLHQKYDFDSLVKIDGIGINEIKNSKILWQEDSQNVTVTINQEEMTFTLKQDPITFEPTMYGANGYITIEHLTKESPQSKTINAEPSEPTENSTNPSEEK